MVFCPKCGAEHGDDIYFCPMCGARTAKGSNERVEPHWRRDLDKALENASQSLEAGVKEARRSLEEVARDLGPELEQAKEGLKDTAEDVGDGIRNVAERLTGRREKPRNYCASCGAKNAEGAKFCVECGKPLA